MKPWFPFSLKPKEKQDGPRYADLYERGLSAAVDITLLFLMLHRIFDYLSARIYRLSDRNELVAARDAATAGEAFMHAWAAGLPQFWLLNALIQIVVMGIFIVGCQVNWGTTPGKWLLGLGIRRDNATLDELSDWRFVLRYLAYIPAAPLFFLISFNKKHRGLHDRIANTVVIHLRPEGWYWQQLKRGFIWLKGKLVLPPAE